MAPNSRLGFISKSYARKPRRNKCYLLHSDAFRFQSSRIMSRLGCAYVVVQACLILSVISASPPVAFDIMDTPLIGTDHVSNSSSPDSMIFTDMNTQSIAINDTGNAGLQVRCNGQKFGTPLNLQSCAATIALIATYDKEETFAMRPYEGRNIDYGLPYRWLNGRFRAVALTNLNIVNPFLLINDSGRPLQSPALSSSTCKCSPCEYFSYQRCRPSYLRQMRSRDSIERRYCKQHRYGQM